MHLSVHSTTDGHDLTEPTGLLENRNCSVHNELLRYYCFQHNACICQSCYVSREHRGHQVESLFEASERKKEKLRKVLGRLTSRKKDTEKRVSVLKDRMREFEEQANSMEVRVMALIRDMKEQLDILEKRVLSEISRQRGQVFIHISDLVQELEIKKDELFAKILQIEEVCNMNDPFSVLQGREADRVATYNAEMEGNGERYDGGAQIVGDLDEVLVSVTLQTAFDDMVTRLKSRNPLFLSSLSDIELDVNTAANNIVISRDLKMASWSLIDQCYPQVPGRMETCQVLSTKSIPSRHYWEVETSGSGEFH
uniref:B box-type domain-containing protein n=1 Tax=Leptobrachium leishanense TaxID=445787 RepID=A0A8C5PVD4_9ANUR